MTKLGKISSDLIRTNVAVIGFNGKSTIVKGMIPLRFKVGSVVRPTMFVVITSKASFNMLLERDWIHGVGVVPSTLHQKLILWNEGGKIEEIRTDDSPCYVEQMHVNFKDYNTKVKPIHVDLDTFDSSIIEWCLGGPDR